MVVAPRRRNVTTLVLGLLVLLMGSGSLLLAASSPAFVAEPARYTTLLPVAAPVDVTGAAAPATFIGPVAPTMSLDAALVGAPAVRVPAKAVPSPTPWDGAHDVNDLPAWRWRSIDLDVDTSGGFMGITGSFKQIPVQIAEMLFHAANFLWQIVLMVLKLGFESDGLIKAGAPSINAGAAFMADKMLYFAIPLGAVVAWRFVRDFLKFKGGSPVGLLRTLMTFAVSFGLIYMVATQSRYAMTTHPPTSDANKTMQLKVPGTLPWMASEILDLVDKVTSPLTGPVIGGKNVQLVGKDAEKSIDQQIAEGSVNRDVDGANGDVGSRGVNTAPSAGATTCVNYIETIYGTYANAPDAERTLIVVSRLWESTFYESWKSSAFGEPVTFRSSGGPYASNIPERVMCHFAESVNDVSAAEQQKISRAAYGNAFEPFSDTSTTPAVFGPFDASNNKEQRKAMTAWAACKWTGSNWKGQVEFDGAWAQSGNPYDGLCSAVMQGTGELDKYFYVFGSDVKKATGDGDAAKREQLKAARSYGLGYSSANAGQRIISGAIALLVAVAFIFTFGFLGIGLMVAMMFAVAALALALPMALALAAIGRGRQAQPLFKMTLMSLLSHGFLTVILSLIIIISGIFRALLTNFGTLPLVVGALVNGLAPVAAFFAVRKVMKSLGMGDILTPSGAMSFAGAAALKAGGGQFAAAGKRMSSGESLKKVPGLGRKLEKMDRFAPTYANWSEKGRRQRKTAVSKEDAEQTERMRKRIKERGGDTRRARLRNKVDSMRLPGTTKDRLKDIAESQAGRLGKKGALPGFMTAALALSGPAGWAVLAGGGALTGAGMALHKRFRSDADEIDEENATAKFYTKGQLKKGAEIGPYRAETVRDTKNYVDSTVERVAGEIAAQRPGSTDVERMQEGHRAVWRDIVSAYAAATTGHTGELLDKAGVDGIRLAAAKELGYPPRAILASPDGLVFPMGVPDNRKRELNNDQIDHWVHQLPDHVKERQMVPYIDAAGVTTTRPETDGEMAHRYLAEGIAGGMVRPDGSQVSTLSLLGIDPDSKNGREELKAYRSGELNEKLDTFQIVVADSGLHKSMVTAAVEVAREAMKQVSLREVNASMEVFRQQSQAAQEREDSWRNGTVNGSSSGPSETSKQLDTLTSNISQLLVAVNASRENVEHARGRGDNEALTKAAQQMSLAIQKLDASQEQLVEGIGLSMAENFEKQLAAQELRDEKFADSFERTFDAGIRHIETTVGSVGTALEEFKQGTLDLKDMLKTLNDTVTREKKESEDAGAKFQRILREVETTMQTSSTSRSGSVWAAPNARDLANTSGVTPIPGNDPKDKR